MRGVVQTEHHLQGGLVPIVEHAFTGLLLNSIGVLS